MKADRFLQIRSFKPPLEKIGYRSAIVIMFLLILGSSQLAHSQVFGQAQSPSSYDEWVASGNGVNPPLNTDWVPYTGSGPLTYRWGTENFGTPTGVAPYTDIRWGLVVPYGQPDDNLASVIAGAGTTLNPQDMFVVGLIANGDVSQPIQHHCTDPAGNAKYVENYIGVALWRINPATGAIRSGYPVQLDAHVGTCSMPRIVVASNGNLFIAWKELKYGTGCQVTACYFNVAGNSIGTAATVVTVPIGNPGALGDIHELSLATDDAGGNVGAAVLIRNNLGGFTSYDQIWASHFNTALVTNWPAGGPMAQIDAASLSSHKWCPIIKWNEDLQQYDMAWGDDYTYLSTGGATPACITVQGSTALYVLSLPPGGSRLSSAPLDQATHCEFYMEDCRGYSNYMYQGAAVFLYQDYSGGADVPHLNGYVLTSGVMTAFLRSFPGTTTLGYPCSLSKRLVSTGPAQEDVVATWTMDAGGGIYHLNADYFTTFSAGTSAVQPPAATPIPINSPNFKGFGNVNGNWEYLAVPDYSGTTPINGVLDIFALSLSPFTFAGTSPVVTENVRGYNGAYFTASATSSNFCVVNYQQLMGAGVPYTWSDRYTDLVDPETDESRLADMEDQTYDFSSWTIGGIYPYLTSQVNAPVDNNTWEIDPYTAAYDSVTATVYSEIQENGTSDIILGRGGSFFVSGASWNLTSSLRSDPRESFYQPKCAIYYDGSTGDYTALVTYIHEFPAGVSTYLTTYEDVTIDLFTGTITPDPWGPIDFENNGPGAVNMWFRNWAVVPDPATGNNVFVYGSNYTTPGQNTAGQLEAIAFSGASRVWATTVQPANTNPMSGYSIDQVRACYDPNPGNTGAYIVWRETPIANTPGNQSGIALSGVNSTTGATWSGSTMWRYGNINHRGNACVASGGAPNWVCVAWEDEGIGTPALPRRIYATDYMGSGTVITAPTCVSLTGTNEEAHHPDAIANPDNTNLITLAFDHDATTTNGLHPIRLENLNLNLTIPPVTMDIPSPDPTPTLPTCSVAWTMDDAKWSMYGFMQRRPKLISFDAKGSGYPYDSTFHYSNPNNWIMCIYEAEAYDLYQPTPTIGGATPPTYGLTGYYQTMWSLEQIRTGGSTSHGGNNTYLQSNIYARVINPALVAGPDPTEPQIAGKLAVFANTNAQDLRCVTYNDKLGPIATCLDYVNTAQTSAIARINRVIPLYYMTPELANIIAQGGTPPGDWGPVPALTWDDKSVMPIYMNWSYMPLVLTPAAGSMAAPTTLPLGTWSITPGYATDILDPYLIAGTEVRYVEPASPTQIGSAVLLTALVSNIAGQWPINLPHWWGNSGTYGGPGCGLKKNPGSTAIGTFAIELTQNPAAASTTAIVNGLSDDIQQLNVTNLLGQTYLTRTAIASQEASNGLPLNIQSWPSGIYNIDIIDNSGNHAHAALSVLH